MYKQEKEYVVLAKAGKKLADAGLCKLSILGQKIRVEYFLNPLPVHYGMGMECVLRFRQKGETTSAHRWKETLEKTNSHYNFSVTLQKDIEEIVDCRLILQGNQMIVADAGLSAIEEPLTRETKESEIKSEKIISPKLQYIRNLDYLKDGNEEMRELYYNSFLLHGFYQYRYFVMGDDFIGVPDHFYEREAIAARMMGFPYFMEAEFMENCNLGGETRKELPKQGSFGYYLRKLGRSEQSQSAPRRVTEGIIGRSKSANASSSALE